MIEKSYDENLIFNMKQVFEDIVDQRNPDEIKKQNNSIISLSNENFKNFKINEDYGVKTSNAQRNLRKYENKDSKWYCFYTDNLQDLKLTKQDLTLPNTVIFTVHGGALDFKELTKLENVFGDKTCRWINFAFPGYDGYDDKRGSFTGGTKDVSNLIVELLDHLGIGQIIFLCHSFGGYVRNFFTFMYPQRVIATVSIATHSISHNIGMRSWTECMFRTNEYFTKSEQEVLQELKDESKRQTIAKNINTSFQYMKENIGLRMSDIDDNKIFSMLRYLISQEIPIGMVESFKYLNPNIPNFITFGYDDPLISLDKQIETIYYYQNYAGRQQFKLNKSKEIQNILQGIDFDYDKEVFFDNFLFMFQSCGHTPHIKKANELGPCLKIFVNLIDYLNSTNQLKHLTQTFPKL